VFLTSTISVASCDYTFSKLKMIKIYLRSTMSETRINNLAVFSTERELVEKLNLDMVVEDCAFPSRFAAFHVFFYSM